MRIATKLRRAVTINTAARKLRQTTITGYERKFRQVVLKFKALSTLFDKVQQSTTQNLKVYQTVRLCMLLLLLSACVNVILFYAPFIRRDAFAQSSLAGDG